MRTLSVLTVLGLMVAGCDAGGAAGAGSPEAVFENMKIAFDKKDYAGAFNQFDPEGHDMLLLGMAMGAGFATMGNEDAKKDLEALEGTHKINKGGKMEMDEAKMKDAAREMFKDVPNKGALYPDLMGIEPKYSDKGAQLTFDAATAELQDLKIDGDSATATFKDKNGEKPVHFIKRNSRWYASMTGP